MRLSTSIAILTVLLSAAVLSAAELKVGDMAPDFKLQASDGKTYRVNVEQHKCDCPDHTETGLKCKHQFAVEFTIKRQWPELVPQMPMYISDIDITWK